MHVWGSPNATSAAVTHDGGEDEADVVVCVVKSTPPHFVANGMPIMVLHVVAHTFVGTKLPMTHNRCHIFSAI